MVVVVEIIVVVESRESSLVAQEIYDIPTTWFEAQVGKLDQSLTKKLKKIPGISLTPTKGEEGTMNQSNIPNLSES